MGFGQWAGSGTHGPGTQSLLLGNVNRAGIFWGMGNGVWAMGGERDAWAWYSVFVAGKCEPGWYFLGNGQRGLGNGWGAGRMGLVLSLCCWKMGNGPVFLGNGQRGVGNGPRSQLTIYRDSQGVQSNSNSAFAQTNLDIFNLKIYNAVRKSLYR